MEYNTQKKKLVIPEYGRCVQEMIEYAVTVKDREKRNKIACEIVRQMKSIQQSNYKNVSEMEKKLWSHLFIISNFKLDVDAPYPKPASSNYILPSKLKYNNNHKEMPYRYYGSIIHNMVKTAVLMDDSPEKDKFVYDIANNMKKSYLTWNKSTVDDKVIFEHLSQLSNGHITVPQNWELATNFNIPSTDILPPTHTQKKKKKKKNFR